MRVTIKMKLYDFEVEFIKRINFDQYMKIQEWIIKNIELNIND